jgi:hypothetical protein
MQRERIARTLKYLAFRSSSFRKQNQMQFLSRLGLNAEGIAATVQRLVN